MDQAQLMLLSNEQREAHRQLEELFGHPGWAIIHKFVAQEHDTQVARELSSPNWDGVQFARGAKTAYAVVAMLPQYYADHFAQMAAQAAIVEETLPVWPEFA